MTFTFKKFGWFLLAVLFIWRGPVFGFPDGGRKDPPLPVARFGNYSKIIKPAILVNQKIGQSVTGLYDKSRLVGDPVPWTMWHGFLGSSAIDEGHGIAVDGSGNIYITGSSSASWGTTTVRRQYSGGSDAFVAKVSPSGELLWNTFLGSAVADQGQGLAVDGSGNVYVTGYSDATWGIPTRLFSSGSNAFAAKLDADGTLLWNTFLGSSSDQGQSIAVDGSGNVYVAGSSGDSWGDVQTIKRLHSGGNDAFVAKLERATGGLIWNAFLGSAGQDYGQGITVDGSGNAYVVGTSGASWGDIIKRTYSGSGTTDAFVAKLNTSGVLQWNTFLGSGSQDYGWGIAVDLDGMLFVTGESDGHWQGSNQPVRQYSGGIDAFVAKLNNAGVLQWNTFLGSNNQDYGKGIAVDRIGNVFVSGYSGAGWEGAVSVRAFSGNFDGFAAKLDGTGTLVWNSFLGSGSYDYGHGLTVDGSGNVCVIGFSDATWANPPPVRGFTPGASDAFVARLSYNLLTISGTIRYNGTGLAEVVLSGLPGDPLTDTDGRYSATIDSGWTGTVTPILTGYSFNPVQMDYNNVTQEKLGQDYLASIATTHLISGQIKAGETALAGVTVTASLGGSTVTDANGYYEIAVNEGWTVTVTPTQDGCSFSPGSRTYNPVTQEEPGQDYAATLMTFTLSGKITYNASSLSGVVMTGLPGTPTPSTNASGIYTATVNYGWSGTVTPTLAGYSFDPGKVDYLHLIKNSTQNYQAVRSYTISGVVYIDGLRSPGVTLNGLPGNPITASGANPGYYEAAVPQGWSGIVIPTLEGHIFTPPNLPYTTVTANQPGQDYYGRKVFTISGKVIEGVSGPGLPGVVLDGPPEYTVTDKDGFYTATVYQGWEGLVTPILTGYRFSPGSVQYPSVNGNQANADYIAAPVPTYIISGVVTEKGASLPGVTLTASRGGAAVTSGDGSYQLTVNEDWSGSVTPSKGSYRFTPENRSYLSVNANQTGGDYGAVSICTISGYVREKGQAKGGVTLTVIPGESTVTDDSGHYQITVDKGWSGTITPFAAETQFSPPNRIYDHIAFDHPSQNYFIGSMIYLPLVTKPH